MALINSKYVGVHLLKALGIDPRYVRRVELTLEVNQPPMLRITQFVTVEGGATIDRVFEMTEWHERPAEPPASPEHDTA
jgi:hypothetical protein